VDKELGIQVIVSTTIAIGTRTRIAVEEEISVMLDRLNQLSGPESEAIKVDAFKHIERIRSHMDEVSDEVLRLLSELRKEWSRIGDGTANKRRGRPATKPNTRRKT
tara:strand:+ start:237 stop:554 length:318 start_codon:yes stop_codon:yes gene_type:complete